MPVLSCQLFLCLLERFKFGSLKPEPLLIWLSTMVGKNLWCYSLEGWCWQWKEIPGFECLSVYLFIYFCVQQWENIFIFLLVLSNHFIHRSRHQSAKLDCNNFSLSLISLGPQWNAARLGENLRGICKEEMATLVSQGHHDQLVPPVTLGCWLHVPPRLSAAHRWRSCRRLPCLSEWRGHALPPRLLALPSALSCLWTPDLDCSCSSPMLPSLFQAPRRSRVSWNPAARGLLVDWYKQS